MKTNDEDIKTILLKENYISEEDIKKSGRIFQNPQRFIRGVSFQRKNNNYGPVGTSIRRVIWYSLF